MAIFGKTLDVTIDGDGVVRFKTPGNNAWVKYKAFSELSDDAKIAFMLDNVVAIENLAYPTGEPVTVESLRAKLAEGEFPILHFFELLKKYDQALGDAIRHLAGDQPAKNASTPGSPSGSGPDSGSPDSTASTVQSYT